MSEESIATPVASVSNPLRPKVTRKPELEPPNLLWPLPPELPLSLQWSFFGIVNVGLWEELPAASKAIIYINCCAQAISYFGVTNNCVSEIVTYVDKAPLT